MAINLLEKAAKRISTYFTTESLAAGRLSTEYDWSGVKTVKIIVTKDGMKNVEHVITVTGGKVGS